MSDTLQTHVLGSMAGVPRKFRCLLHIQKKCLVSGCLRTSGAPGRHLCPCPSRPFRSCRPRGSPAPASAVLQSRKDFYGELFTNWRVPFQVP